MTLVSLVLLSWVGFLVRLTCAAVIPYREPTKDKNEGDISSTMSSTLPMAAVSDLPVVYSCGSS